jgi:MinD-like ATPase involved in chromosome partitioning or flagellar assembly
VNEPFKILLDQQRVVTAETVKECVFPVWADEPHLLCVPPPAASDEAAFSSPQACRTLLSVLEVLQTLNDAIVVDASPMTLGVRQALYQVADDVVFVLNKDPAGAFASRHVLSLISGHIRRDARLIAVVNDLRNGGAPLSALRDCIAVPGDRAVRMVTIPFSSRAGRWPCSGYTPSRYLRKYFAKILPDALDQSEERNTSLETPWESILHERGANFLKAIFRRLHRKKTNEGHGVDASRPSAAVRHGHGALPLLTGPAPEDELVSKPVLAG